MIRLTGFSFSTVLACSLLASADTRADSWAAPHTSNYDSTGGEYRLTTIPPGESGNPERDRTRARCLGRLQHKEKDGTYVTVWEKPLSNSVSPVSALVSQDGKSVVTFDNWHSMGHGKNAVVLYGPGGKLIRELALHDFLSPAEVDRLTRSVSSIWWGSGHALDEKNGVVILKVSRNDPFEPNKGEPKPPLEIRVGLETGKIVDGPKAEEGKPAERP